jgi:hypothetical protein
MNRNAGRGAGIKGRARWRPDEAKAWHAEQPWLFGCNFTPSSAINQLEMWQLETFDVDLMREELALAASVGMNVARIYLHDLLWDQDPGGFALRIDIVLEAAAAQGIRVMPVLFDSCWDPEPALGAQRPPRPGVHNSGWVQSPGLRALSDPAEHARLEDYVKGVVGHFRDDPRIVAWDVWNEPDNGPDVENGSPEVLDAKARLVAPLLAQAFEWARSQGPTQPLTSGVWLGDWSSEAALSAIQRVQLGESDVTSFHNYGTVEDFERRILWLRAHDRPILCTEFMARRVGSTFQAILPVAHAHGVAAICWGLVRGKTQTHLPWSSFMAEGENADQWFHDVFEPDGTPHSSDEIAFLRALTGRDRPPAELAA